MRRMAAWAALAVGSVRLAAAADAGLSAAACDGLPAEGLRCFTLTVPEDPDAPDARTLRLHVAIAPARRADPLADPVYLFFGGPGAAASREIERSLARWTGLVADRDLVFIDQRGTGRSAPMYCEPAGDPDDPGTYALDLFDTRYLAACRDQYAGSHDLARYTTGDAVRDAESVRHAFGHARINLVGESYGTRVVQEYLRRHPERARAAVLLGAVPPGASITEGMARALDATLEQFFASCEADAACAGAYPRLRADTAALLDRAGKGGLSAAVGLDGGAPRTVTIGRAQALAWIRSRLYSVQASARLPQVLAAAAAGDARELVAQALTWRRQISRELAEGLYASVACAEDMPFVDVARETADAAGTRMGDHRLATQQAACALWPRAAVAADFKAPLESRTPLLVINGDRDPATGLEWARAAAAGPPNARLVIARNRSHALAYEFDSCLGPMVERFIAAPDPDRVDDACAVRLRLPPFETGVAAPEPRAP